MDPEVVELVRRVEACTVRMEEVLRRLDGHDTVHEDQDDRITTLERLKWKDAGGLSLLGLVASAVWALVLKYI